VPVESPPPIGSLGQLAGYIPIDFLMDGTALVWRPEAVTPFAPGRSGTGQEEGAAVPRLIPVPGFEGVFLEAADEGSRNSRGASQRLIAAVPFAAGGELTLARELAPVYEALDERQVGYVLMGLLILIAP